VYFSFVVPARDGESDLSAQHACPRRPRGRRGDKTMPQPQDDDVKTPKPKPEGGGQSKLILIMLMVNMLAIVGIGVFLVLGGNRGGGGGPAANGGGGDGAAQAGDGQAGQPAAAAGPVEAAMDSFTVNLNDLGKRSFLRVTLNLSVDSPAVVEEMTKRSAPIRNEIITYLSSLKPEETQGMVNKERIRTTILRLINSQLTSGKILAVYFTDFIIQ